MNEPKYEISKIYCDPRPNFVLRVLPHHQELETKQKLHGMRSVLRKMLLRFTQVFKVELKSKNDLTYEKFVRLESKPTKHSDYK